MKELDHILNWKLLEGSHKFPGPDGGTCINEVAVIAAGFDYRAVKSVTDLPPCFSRVFAYYVLILNDQMDDDVRTRLLLPFVLRLAGTADSNEVERQRVNYMLVNVVKRILGPQLRKLGLNDAARTCEDASDEVQAGLAVQIAHEYAEREHTKRTPCSVRELVELEWASRITRNLGGLISANPTALAGGVAQTVAVAMSGQDVWQTACAILDEAMAIGRRPDPLDIDLVTQRLDAVRRPDVVDLSEVD